jgi:hypothetical protein
LFSANPQICENVRKNEVVNYEDIFISLYDPPVRKVPKKKVQMNQE